MTEPLLASVRQGWSEHQRKLVEVIAPLTDEQLQLRPSPEHWAIWQLASNLAGGRAFWLHDILGEGDPAVREMFRVSHSTIPEVPLEDAGWEGDEDHPRGASDLVSALEKTWQLVEDCLGRWSASDLAVEFSRPGGRVKTFTRAWVLWHMVEHDLQHGSEIALILRANGLPTIEL
jgi:uncharacterized damage-inducible protein DinB